MRSIVNDLMFCVVSDIQAYFVLGLKRVQFVTILKGRSHFWLTLEKKRKGLIKCIHIPLLGMFFIPLIYNLDIE